MKLTSSLLIFQNILLFHELEEVNGKKGFGPGEQEWGYVTVRPGAHMFWWLYYATPVSPPPEFSVFDKPLIVWLQGGPGASSTGVGNFEEFGPIDVNGNSRNFTWVHDYNVLFIDNPVGTGYSYVESNDLFTKNNTEIAVDLLECVNGFLTELPYFRNVSTFVVSQSYGGKMAAEFVLMWFKAQREGSIRSNVRGVGFGNSWISPIDSILSWGPFLFSTGYVDKRGKDAIETAVEKVKRAADEGSWLEATRRWIDIHGVVSKTSGDVDWYNVLTKVNPKYTWSDEELEKFMQNVTTALNISVTWGNQSNRVFIALENDFMKNVTDIVKELKEEPSLEVFVYSGQLDFIVATPGTVAWVDRLFEGTNEWYDAPRTPLIVNDIVEGHKKELRNFKMYWISRAGHYAPLENAAAIGEMLKHMTQTDKSNLVH